MGGRERKRLERERRSAIPIGNERVLPISFCSPLAVTATAEPITFRITNPREREREKKKKDNTVKPSDEMNLIRREREEEEIGMQIKLWATFVFFLQYNVTPGN